MKLVSKFLIFVALMCAIPTLVVSGCSPDETTPIGRLDTDNGDDDDDKPEPEPKPEPDKSSLRCVGYIPTWAPDCYTTMDWSALTHLNIAFYYPGASGDMGMPLEEQTLKKIVAKAHENGVKVLASIRGGASGVDIKTLMAADKRAGFIARIIEHVEKYDLDGVDSDLEEGNSAFWVNYEPFIVDLNEACDANGLLLTTAVSTWFSDNITDKAFACFDFINLMAYDLGFANHSSIEGAKSMVDHYLNVRKIPADRIVLGVPFYGYDKSSTGWGNGEFKSIAYKDVIAADPAAWDKDTSGLWVYNGATTIAAKSTYARDYGGIMIWELSQDAPGNKALLKVIGKNLFESGAAPRPVNN
jgi:GH18 family chitinase